MTEFWTDAHLSPMLARWIRASVDECTARTLRDLGLEYAPDTRIFDAAANAGAVILTKDRDFVKLAAHRSPSPQIVHLTCGNTSTRHLQRVLEVTLPRVLARLAAGDRVVAVFDEDSLR